LSTGDATPSIKELAPDVFAALFGSDDLAIATPFLESPDPRRLVRIIGEISICGGAPRVVETERRKSTPRIGEILTVSATVAVDRPKPVTAGVSELPSWVDGWAGWASRFGVLEIERLPYLKI
jgi:hypothetical protein